MSDFTKYQSINIGDKAELIKKISEEDVRKFVNITGDDNPLHTNREYAETTPFKGVVVHGMLGASFISTVIGTKLPGEGALWVSQNFDFLLPVRLGDELTVTCTVTKKYDREQLIDLETVIKNQNHAVVLKGSGKVKILEIQSKKEATKQPKLVKVAIVTGATGGIGAAICRQLAQEKYKIVLNYRNDFERATALQNEIIELGGEAILCRADISQEADIKLLVKQAVSSYGGISLLVNNASPRISPCRFEDIIWDQFQNQIDVQLKAPFVLMNLCIPIMKELGGGSIVNISTQAIDGTPSPNWTAYATAKSALSCLSNYAAFELGQFGIRVNQVSPGMTDTSLVGDIPEKARLIIARQTPLRRLATPEDIANAVSFLASDKALHITGETLRVNGGAVMI